MIPKTIHYCWFGRGEKPKLAQNCIASWKKFCPDYEVIEWNEDNFDVNTNGYTRMCHEQKKYAFLSDYVRLYVVEKFGGVYFDTDVELLRPIEPLLGNEAFFGFENDQNVASGLGFGAEAGNPVVQAMLAEYNTLLDGEHGVTGCPTLNTRALVKLGLRLDGSYQQLTHAAVYPAEYFNPYDDPTGTLNKTKNTYSVHWYAKSWLSRGTVLRSTLTKPFHRLFGADCFKWLKK